MWLGYQTIEEESSFLYYQDRFQRPNPFRPDIAIDITSVYDRKIYSMAAHESQFLNGYPG